MRDKRYMIASNGLKSKCRKSLKECICKTYGFIAQISKQIDKPQKTGIRIPRKAALRDVLLYKEMVEFRPVENIQKNCYARITINK